MTIRWKKRAVALTILSALASVTFEGCTTARMVSAPQTTSAVQPPKKEYQWRDMSDGPEIYGKRAKPTPE